MSTLTLRPSGDSSISINIVTPTSPGTHYTAVDESVLDEADYVQESSVAATKDDLYTLPDHTSETGIINSVKVYAQVKTVDVQNPTGHGYCDVIIKMGIITYAAGLNYHGNSSLQSYTWTTNPNTSAAWTWTNIDDLVAGVRLSCWWGGKLDQCFSQAFQVYVEVDYTLVKTLSAKIGLLKTYFDYIWTKAGGVTNYVRALPATGVLALGNYAKLLSSRSTISRLISVVKIGIKSLSAAKKFISQRLITTAKIGDLAKPLVRKFIFVRLITAAKIGLLRISVTKAITKVAITAAKIGDLAKTLSRKFVFSRQISPKIGLLYTSIKKYISKVAITSAKIGLLVVSISKKLISHRLITVAKIGIKVISITKLFVGLRILTVTKLGILSTIKRALVVARSINPKLGLLPSIRKAVKTIRSLLPKLGLLSTLTRLELDVYKFTTLLGVKALSLSRKIISARLISAAKVGLLPKIIRGFFKSITSRLGIIIPRSGQVLIRLLSASMGLLQKGLARIPILARLIAPKIGLLATKFNQSIYHRIMPLTKMGVLVISLFLSKVRMLATYLGLKITQLYFKTLVWIFFAKVGDYAKSLSKFAVFGRKITTAKLGLLIKAFFTGRENMINIPLLMIGLKININRLNIWARNIIAKDGLVVTYMSNLRNTLKMLQAFIGELTALYRIFSLSKKFSSTIGILAKIAEKEIREVVLAIKLGIKAVIIRLAARKKIFYVLLGLKQIFSYFRKIYGYKVLKFITRVYKLLFKEEEEIK